MIQTRREFLRTTGALGVAAWAGGARGQDRSTSRPFSRQEIRRVRTPVLEIGYEDSGSDTGYPILLLHGFPYDARSWDGVVPRLADAGFRVLVPYSRGFGPTRFLDPTVPRTAQQAAIAQDLIDFADALELEEFAVAGFDWGNRAACIAAILHPERVRAQVSIGGYSVQDTVAPSASGTPAVAALLWYQWYFNTEQGRAGLEANRRAICRYLWDSWSPGWRYGDEAFDRSAPSFDNPDFVDVVIHSYRHRHGNAPGEDRFAAVERFLAEQPPVPVPTVVLRPAASGFGSPSPDPSGDRARFSVLVARRIVEGAGHDLPVQRPEAVSLALSELLS